MSPAARILLGLAAGIGILATARAAEVESRVLTHFLPQDFLENQVLRSDKCVAVDLSGLKGGIKAGDMVHIWVGGSIDWGNAHRPGLNITRPWGESLAQSTQTSGSDWAIAADPEFAHALVFKTETGSASRCFPEGKALSLKMTKDNEKLFIAFNDRKGCYADNHSGRGRDHVLDPLWVRVDVVRIVVD